MTPHPLATFDQPIRLTNHEAAQIPGAHILCTEGADPDEPEPAFLARIRLDPAWRIRELAADHMAPVTAPRKTAEVLMWLVCTPRHQVVDPGRHG